MEESSLLHTCNKTTSTFTLNNPSKINALNQEMITTMLSVITSYQTEQAQNIPKILFYEANGKHFCSGGNVVSIYNAVKDKEYKEIEESYKTIVNLIKLSIEMKPLQIVLWKGFVMGGGVGISINAPVRIATETTTFSMPECQLGHFPDVGASYFFRKFYEDCLPIGLYVGLMGYRLKGKELVNCGIATHIIKESQWDEIKKEIEQIEMENCSKDDIKNKVHEILKKYRNEEIMNKEGEGYLNENKEFIMETFKPDSIFQIVKRLEYLSENNKGNQKAKDFADNTLKFINKSSPLSMLIFVEMFKQAEQLNSITECFERDFESSMQTMINGDFTEGVRSILIDKDKQFNWKYKTVQDISEPEEIIKKFCPWKK